VNKMAPSDSVHIVLKLSVMTVLDSRTEEIDTSVNILVGRLMLASRVQVEMTPRFPVT